MLHYDIIYYTTPNPHHKIMVFPDPTLGNPWKVLAHPSKYLSNIFVLGNPTLGENLVTWILVMRTGCTASPPIKSFDFRGFDSSKLLIIKGGNSHVHRI